MIGNNRVCFAPDVEVKAPIPKKLVPQEDGKLVFVDDVSPFKDLDGNSFKISSQLKNGVHLKDCGIRHLEKTDLADKANNLGESVQNEVNAAKAAKASKSSTSSEESK